MLTCKLCGESGYKNLAQHLRRTHGVSGEEYVERFPGSPLWMREVRCVVCKQLIEGYSGGAANVKCDGCRITPIKHKRGVDEEGLVACRICGVQRRRLDHHIKTHGVTRAEYEARFPGAPVFVPGSMARSATCRAKQSTAATARWQVPGARETQSERMRDSAPWKGQRLSAEHRARISAGGKGVSHDLSAEDLARCAARLHRGFAEAMADPRRRVQFVRKLGAGVQRRIAGGELVGWMDPETQRKSYETCKANGTLNPPGAGRGITGFRKGLEHYFRSTLEANFARVLVLAGIAYEYEPKVFKLPNGKTYTPDFKLAAPLGDLVPAGWVELKGCHTVR